LFLGLLNASKSIKKSLPANFIEVHVDKQLLIFPFLNVVVGDFVEAAVKELIVVSDEKLPKTCVAFGEPREIILVGTVVKVLELKYYGFLFFRISE
jgi:hypothetical protein